MLHAHQVNFLKVSTHRLSFLKHDNGGRKRKQDVISVWRWVPAAWRPAGGGSDGCRLRGVSLLPFNLCWGNWYSYIIPHFKLSEKRNTPHPPPQERKKKTPKKQESRCAFLCPALCIWQQPQAEETERAGQTDIVTLIAGAWFSAEGAVRSKILFSFQQRVKLFPVQLFGMPLSDWRCERIIIFLHPALCREPHEWLQ